MPTAFFPTAVSRPPAGRTGYSEEVRIKQLLRCWLERISVFYCGKGKKQSANLLLIEWAKKSEDDTAILNHVDEQVWKQLKRKELGLRSTG